MQARLPEITGKILIYPICINYSGLGELDKTDHFRRAQSERLPERRVSWIGGETKRGEWTEIKKN